MDDRLVELDFGDWEGQRWADINRADFDLWSSDYVTQNVPGGESWGDVRKRVESFLNDLRESPGPDRLTAADALLAHNDPSAPTAVIAHAGVIRAALSIVLDIPLKATWRISVPFGCVVTIELSTTPDNDQLLEIYP